MRNRARAYMCLPYSYGKPTSCCVVVVLFRKRILERELSCGKARCGVTLVSKPTRLCCWFDPEKQSWSFCQFPCAQAQ